jgi:pyruvate dehydrogenase E1 component
MAGSRAASAREPGQIREEAALSDTARAPRRSLAGADDRRARPGTSFEGGCTVHTPVVRDLDTLRSIERRVLWLATAIVHHANRVRDNRSGLKVGGHQASSASMVTLMTALWFSELRAEDRVSVKPHASPVLHAINYLLGRLDRPYLETLRAFGGLQSYPSRTKDPDPVDFSTGSVAIGATAPIWAAMARRYLETHRLEAPPIGRQIAIAGDAELDEGAVWEAVADPGVANLGEVLWVIDLNRQSLDRVVPDIAFGRWAQMFEAAGWQTITVKYGRLLESVFERPGGTELRRRIDRMPNEEYQRLLRASPEELRERVAGSASRRGRRLAHLVGELDEAELRAAIRDLGGHDPAKLIEAYRAVDGDRPSVIFAYTIKGWSLPIEGHPENHSALLTDDQMATLAAELGADPADPWAAFDPASPEGELCAAAAAVLARDEPEPQSPPRVPPALGRRHRGSESTQQAFGRFFFDLVHEAPEVAQRVVTVSPDVASSTNLGGWINKSEIWSVGERRDWFADDPQTLVHWRETTAGRHIELGIAETNLVGLLGELGAAWSRYGQPLLPIGTIYDPFVGRALEPWSFGMYAGGQSILVGTPSGVSLAPEGGAHQSIVTPSIGIGQPGCAAWEPAFGQDLEWALLHALSRLGRPDGESAYFRLSTRPIDQSLAGGDASEERRRQVLAGGYALRRAAERPRVTLVGMGAVLPELLAAADALAEPVDVICVTSADLLFRAVRGRAGFGTEPFGILGELFPADRAAPIVSVLDGAPHALAFLAAVNATSLTPLGVTDFGQSGDLAEVYEHHQIDAETIVGAALDMLG